MFGEAPFLGPCECDPLAVGRPGEIADLPRLVDHGRLLRSHVDELEPVLLVGPEQAFGVRRPAELVLVRVAAGRQLRGGLGAVLGADVDFILAGDVGDVGDPLAVGGPCGAAFMDAGVAVVRVGPCLAGTVKAIARATTSARRRARRHSL